jgi:hypothetical protein
MRGSAAFHEVYPCSYVRLLIVMSFMMVHIALVSPRQLCRFIHVQISPWGVAGAVEDAEPVLKRVDEFTLAHYPDRKLAKLRTDASTLFTKYMRSVIEKLSSKNKRTCPPLDLVLICDLLKVLALMVLRGPLWRRCETLRTRVGLG